jgi:hypothetical protein
MLNGKSFTEAFYFETSLSFVADANSCSAPLEMLISASRSQIEGAATSSENFRRDSSARRSIDPHNASARERSRPKCPESSNQRAYLVYLVLWLVRIEDYGKIILYTFAFLLLRSLLVQQHQHNHPPRNTVSPHASGFQLRFAEPKVANRERPAQFGRISAAPPDSAFNATIRADCSR